MTHHSVDPKNTPTTSSDAPSMVGRVPNAAAKIDKNETIVAGLRIVSTTVLAYARGALKVRSSLAGPRTPREHNVFTPIQTKTQAPARCKGSAIAVSA
jgi:hypothetical protein